MTSGTDKGATVVPVETWLAGGKIGWARGGVADRDSGGSGVEDDGRERQWAVCGRYSGGPHVLRVRGGRFHRHYNEDPHK